MTTIIIIDVLLEIRERNHQQKEINNKKTEISSRVVHTRYL